MSTLSQFVSRSPIKSIQRGTITISNAAVTATATISSVTTSKTQLNYLGTSTNNAGLIYSLVRIALTSSTVITATRGNDTSGSDAIVSYEVIEYN